MTTQRPACCRWITWDAHGRLREFWPEPSRGPDDAGAFMRIMQAAREVALDDDPTGQSDRKANHARGLG